MSNTCFQNPSIAKREEGSMSIYFGGFDIKF